MKIKESLTNIKRMFSVIEKGPEIFHLVKLHGGIDEKIRWVTGLRLTKNHYRLKDREALCQTILNAFM